MSEVKLNLIDANSVLSGTIHGSDADRCIAALSAEPETIAELTAALARYSRGSDPFADFRSKTEIDAEPHDAGIVIIDMASRVIAVDSTYSSPSPEGDVTYHDGEKATDVSITYRIPDDWRFVNSVEAYRWTSERRRREREANPPIDTRAVLYGAPLMEFIKNSVSAWCAEHEPVYLPDSENTDGFDEATMNAIVRIHAEWLMTPREDLRGKSPREVLLEKQDLIDFDLHSRCLQWSFLGKGPPCLAKDSFAYRFSGFGTHEWVVYYDLVRYLISCEFERASGFAQALGLRRPVGAFAGTAGVSPAPVGDATFAELTQLASTWLDNPQPDYDGRTPAIIIDNERKRLPQTMGASEVIIDDDCELCRMSAQEVAMGALAHAFGASTVPVWKTNSPSPHA